jgi:hypothetical protein
MKKIIRTLAFIMALNLTMVSCQKEQEINPQWMTPEYCNTETVSYFIDGVQHVTVLSNAEEWRAFLDRLFALAEEGYTVSFRSSTYSSVKSNREVVTYTTIDKEDAKKWAKQKEADGYDVSIEYNVETGIYTCIAVK